MTLKIEENINRLIEKKNWTLYRLAKESGVSPSVLYELSNKKYGPNIEILIKFADALGTTVDEIVRGEK